MENEQQNLVNRLKELKTALINLFEQLKKYQVGCREYNLIMDSIGEIYMELGNIYKSFSQEELVRNMNETLENIQRGWSK